MRRPSEQPNLPTASAPDNRAPADLSTGLLARYSGTDAGLVAPGLLSRDKKVDLESNPPTDRLVGGPVVSESGTGSVNASIGGASTLAGSRHSEATAVLETIQRLTEQAVARGQDRLSMTLRFDNGDSVRIRLIREGGQLHTILQTDVPGLEATLRQQWSHFSQDAGERGFKFQSMTFTDFGDSSGRDRSSDRGNAPETFAEAESNFFNGPAAAGLNRSNPSTPARRPVQQADLSARLRAWV